ncbi:MAG: hypothetical protein E6I94_05815 [Chloroflexi bacterium]|nr:MAG: hypothetical protein E6I94_05815 [Chloroflexota bacterium]
MQQTLLPIFLYLHVMGAIITFGPAFIGPLVGRQVQRMPQGGPFAAVLGHALATRVIIPGAIVQGVTGVALIFGLDLTSSVWRWLILAIVLYLIAISYAIFVQRKAAERMVELTRGLAGRLPPGSAGGPPAGTAGGPPAGTAGGPPAGPPPEVRETAARLQRGGMFLTFLILVIVFLMVVKPTF